MIIEDDEEMFRMAAVKICDINKSGHNSSVCDEVHLAVRLSPASCTCTVNYDQDR